MTGRSDRRAKSRAQAPRAGFGVNWIHTRFGKTHSGMPRTPKYKLEDLLAEIPPGQRFEEFDWGPSVGREILPDDVAEDRSAASISQGPGFGDDETELPIFMDWEFSDLGPVGEVCLPLSVGMITATGASLYLEFTALAPPNNFVREHVLPLMTLDDCVTLPAGRRIIVDWLASHNARIVLTSDSDYDLQMLDWVAPEARKNPNRRYVKITDDPTLGLFSVAPSMQGRLRLNFEDSMNAWFLRTGMPRHHALNDATALRDAWMSVRRS